MKALAWFGKKDGVRVIDAPIPDITEPDDDGCHQSDWYYHLR